jgi:hypothetical protein
MKIVCETTKNVNIGLMQKYAIVRMENDIMGENLQKLYDATDKLGSSKIKETRLNLEIQHMKEERDLYFQKYQNMCL